MPLLAARHRVFAVDLRGFGDSEVADETYSSCVAADDLHGLIGQLGVGPLHLVGQDLSGAAVYRLAAIHADDVLSLTAIESALPGFGAERLADVRHGGVWYVGALAADGIADLLFEKQARAFIGDYLYPHFQVSSAEVGPADVAEFSRSYGRPGGFSGATGLYRSMLTEAEELRAIARDHPLQQPVTTIGSRGGEFTHTCFRNVTTREVTDLRLDGIGHYVAQEAPHALAECLLETFAADRVASHS
jgi:pimeloyl-ACP methyl ester carboxylesterase